MGDRCLLSEVPGPWSRGDNRGGTINLVPAAAVSYAPDFPVALPGERRRLWPR